MKHMFGIQKVQVKGSQVEVEMAWKTGPWKLGTIAVDLGLREPDALTK